MTNETDFYCCNFLTNVSDDNAMALLALLNGPQGRDNTKDN